MEKARLVSLEKERLRRIEQERLEQIRLEKENSIKIYENRIKETESSIHNANHWIGVYKDYIGKSSGANRQHYQNSLQETNNELINLQKELLDYRQKLARLK